MRMADLRGVARAQRTTREVIHEVAQTLKAGDTERAVARRIEERLSQAGVRSWLHTPYAWWGERTRFSRFESWQADALPTDRRLREGEAFILDAAPLVDGSPADYAFAGEEGGATSEARGKMLDALAELKREMVEWARSAASGGDLFERVGAAMTEAGYEPIHPLYPAGVLGHSFDVLPGNLERLPRIGDGFQLSLVGGYTVALLKHRFFGAPFPLINPLRRERPQGLYAVEPHLGDDDCGAKFESLLLIDGDETRWLDPDLFGEVLG